MIIEGKLIRASLIECVKDALDEVNTTRIEKIPTDSLLDIYLYGQGGVFDSLQLVDFIIIFEEKISERIGAALSIVSAKAVSSKVNPFRKVSSLLDYVEEEIGLVPTTKDS